MSSKFKKWETQYKNKNHKIKKLSNQNQKNKNQKLKTKNRNYSSIKYKSKEGWCGRNGVGGWGRMERGGRSFCGISMFPWCY